MRQALVMGNWKLNGTKASVEALATALIAPAKAASNVEVAVCPPVIFLGQVQSILADTPISYGSQDANVNVAGAYTGENSPVMIKEFGAKYSLVGHSERRQYHNETDAVVAAKFQAIQANDLVPVLCIGETLEENEAGKTQEVVERQIQAVIDLCGVASLSNAVIAYEPVWAIGTGKSATAQQAQDVHASIRAFLAAQDSNVAQKIQILYGGSVKGASAAELFGQADIDGGLVGGAALDAEDFAKIIAAAN
ncbi:triose-phosphate isomerase [Alginatibacterium sediminis]|uniref:Triosephosphate isomerase n=1 Tax=Alginatibacterium sediminis TaxID=2164068 RepID=A0A420EHA3_9ALTE|nr:triose-phosphate isomerase [Alginatibacterium sediminis]RKF19936.1 triose-phosphate isomerase [Alginatibacterium sediminis]